MDASGLIGKRVTYPAWMEEENEVGELVTVVGTVLGVYVTEVREGTSVWCILTQEGSNEMNLCGLCNVRLREVAGG